MKNSKKPRNLPLHQYQDAVLVMDLKNVLAHELGHYFVSDELGGRPTVTVSRAGGDASFNGLSVYGNCSYDYGTAFERSCVGWAGEIGTFLLDDYKSTYDDLLQAVFDKYDSFPEDFSASDTEAISAYKKNHSHPIARGHELSSLRFTELKRSRMRIEI